MSDVTFKLNPIGIHAVQALGQLSSFMLAAIASFAVCANVFIGDFHTARFTIALAILLLLHVLRFSRLLVCREFVLYLVFVAFLQLALFWTSNIALAMNTLFPAINFALIAILFGSLVTFHRFSAVLPGLLCGFFVAAGTYTLVEGFPFVRPADFSYNAIAGMYFYGLFVTLLTSCYIRSKGILLLTSLVLLLLIVATTSIKTNLGVLLAIAAVGFIYPKLFATIVWRNSAILITVLLLGVFVLISNEWLLTALGLGVDRIMLGVEILRTGEVLPGYSALSSRLTWIADGIDGWTQSPMIGHGVEAFRDKHGITSHTTPIDLLYNYGLIGFIFFYSIFASLFFRLMTIRDDRNLRVAALVFGIAICYLFMSLSGTLHYSAFLAVFIGVSVAILRHLRTSQSGAVVGRLNE